MKNKKSLLSLASLLLLLAGCDGNSAKPSTSIKTPSVPEISEKPVSNTVNHQTTNTAKPSEAPVITYYTVSFDLNGGTIADDSLVKPQKVQEGHWAKKPNRDPEKKHCTFLGWYDPDDAKFSFSTGIYGDIVLKAKWKVNEEEKVSLTFNPNNGQANFTIETFIGDFPSVPTPTKAGMVFKGWYINGEADKQWTGFVSSEIVGKTLIALYEKQSFNYKYEINPDGTATVTGIYNIDSVTVQIPETINGHAVTKIGEKAFQSRVKLQEVILPKTITDINPKCFIGTTYLQKITVASENQYFKSDSKGILFSKDGTLLVYCPSKALANDQSYSCPSNLVKIGDFAFYDQHDSGINSIIFNEGLEEIGEKAFYNDYRITNLSFPDSLKKIGNSAFSTYQATNTPVNINWGNGLEEIGEHAFVGVYRPTTLNLPDSLKKIGDYAFTCTDDTPNAITKVKLPASLEYFGDAAFFFCYGLKNISLPSSNKNFKVENNRLLSKDGTKLYWVPSDTPNLLGIGQSDILELPTGITDIRPHSLSEVRYLAGVKIPNTVKTIHHNAFHCNYYLTSIEIPNSVETIEEEAFRMREKLTSVTFGNKLTSIGEAAFDECTALQKVEFPSNIKTIGKEAFYGCSSLSTITFHEGLEEIGEKGFGGCSKLAEVSLPNTLTTLGKSAFAECSNIKTISFGTGLVSFGASAFSGATPTSRTVKGNGTAGPKIVDSTLISADGKTVFYCSPSYTGKITIPAGVETINAYAYCQVKATGLDLGTSVKEIGEGAFKSAFALSANVSAVFPTSLEKIDDGAFYFSNLHGATFNEGLKSIGIGAFSSASMGNLVLPSSLETIGRQAFFSAGVTSIEFKEGIKQIDDEAFLANPGLSGTITIPASLTTLGSGVFAGRINTFTNGITDFKVAENGNFNVKDGVLYNKDFTKLYAFPSKSALTSVTLPDTVKEIEKYAFAGASNLTSVTLNNGLETIGERAFAEDKNIKTISIPSTVTSLGYRCFQDWTNTQHVVMPFSEDRTLMRFGDDWKNSTNAKIDYQA